MRAAIRRRDIFVSPSFRYGDPRKGLLDGTAWEAARPAVCRTLGVSSNATEELDRLAKRLDEAFRHTAANLPRGNRAGHLPQIQCNTAKHDVLRTIPRAQAASPTFRRSEMEFSRIFFCIYNSLRLTRRFGIN
jgi:hypothetical protein